MESAQNEILQLLSVPDTDRDQIWENQFLQLFPTIRITLLNDAPKMGPDNFPYLIAEIKTDSTEPSVNILSWLGQKGIGLVINPEKKFPDYIFSYGMIWHFVINGQFTSPGQTISEATIEIESNSTFYVGKPSLTYLPDNTRNMIREFLTQQGVMKPRITMISKDNKNFDLCFSLESFGNPDPSEHMGILQTISWFLPNHYSLALISEKNLPEFTEL